MKRNVFQNGLQCMECFPKGTANEEKVTCILVVHISSFSLLKRQVTFKVTLCDQILTKLKFKFSFRNSNKLTLQLFLARKNDTS